MSAEMLVHVQRQNPQNAQNRAEWVIDRIVSIDINGETRDTLMDGDIVAQVSKLPLREPKYSYKLGMWSMGHFQIFFRSLKTAEEADLRARMVAQLILKVEADNAVLESQARAKKSNVPTRVGKTERDRLKPASGKKTNDPTVSQGMKGKK